MHIRKLHRWDVTPKEAVRIQQRLRDRVRIVPPPPHPRIVAGADCAFTPDGSEVVAAVVVFELPGPVEIERREGRAPVTFPYVPGLLTFREAPALLDAFARVESEPDVVLFDGQGIAHPRRMGLATHLGLWLDRPTVGCAKSRLTGENRGEPGEVRGRWRALFDGEETIGRVVRTRDGVKPMWISPGHRCDVSGAMRVALLCGAGYRLPEPTRVADRAVARLKHR